MSPNGRLAPRVARNVMPSVGLYSSARWSATARSAAHSTRDDEAPDTNDVNSSRPCSTESTSGGIYCLPGLQGVRDVHRVGASGGRPPPVHSERR
eukprot:5800121-Prymnesium_polylepis.1